MKFVVVKIPSAARECVAGYVYRCFSLRCMLNASSWFRWCGRVAIKKNNQKNVVDKNSRCRGAAIVKLTLERYSYGFDGKRTLRLNAEYRIV